MAKIVRRAGGANEPYSCSRKSKSGTGVVVFHGVGVQTDEAHVGGRECEVGRSENLLEHRFARTLAVVIAQQADVRYAQAVEDVALPHELFFQPEIREVAAVEHEVDVVAGVERFDGFFGFIVPALRVADHGETHGLPAAAGGFDAGDVLGVDILLSAYVGVVGVVFDMVAACGEQRKQEQTGS